MPSKIKGITDPEKIRRLVNPEVASTMRIADKITLWCDGAVQGKFAHDRTEYQQRTEHLVNGMNGCPTCGGGGGGRKALEDPELIKRLVRSEDAWAASQMKVTVWCDGTVQGKPVHERVEYQQTKRSFAEGKNSCKICRWG